MNVKRAFSRGSKRTKPSSLSPSNDWVDMQVSKARHMLGLDAARAESSQDGSTSSTSTKKLRSVTFSEATTVPVHAVNTTDDVKTQRLSQVVDLQAPIDFPTEPEHLVCERKPSDLSLQSQFSSGSIQSFYDKEQTPLSISQQTSDSSSRDFALRRGAPSILAESIQETEHLRQLRLVSKSDKRFSRDVRSLHSNVRDDDDLSERSAHQLTADNILERNASVRSKKSRSRISIIRGSSPADNKVVVPIRHTLDHEPRSHNFQPVLDPTQAKLNVRRPKAGTKNWFDDVDSESDEELGIETEPQLDADFALRVENAFEQGNFDMIPKRTSSRSSRTVELQAIHSQQKDKPSVPNQIHPIYSTAAADSYRSKRNRFASVDLQEQSVLYLSSSEDEDEDKTDGVIEDEYLAVPAKPIASLLARRAYLNSTGGTSDNPGAENHRVSTLRIRGTDAVSNHSKSAPPIPKRNSGRLLTHLEDESTDNLERDENLLTSFPLTPTETLSQRTSFQSLTSESNSQSNSRVFSLTKQEEHLIAALRSKRLTIQKAQAMAHREDALRILELDGGHDDTTKTQIKKQMISPISPISPLRISYRSSTISCTPNGESYRRCAEGRLEPGLESERSNRSSMATYLTDTSQDLQLLDESIDCILTGSSTGFRRTASLPKPSRRCHRDFLSPTSSSSTTPISTHSKHEKIASAWDSHFRSFDGQQPREDIPSQLFMEKPYIGWQGWEGRTTDLPMVAH